MFKTAAKGMAWTTSSTIVRSVAQMLQYAILTRYLEKADFGIVAIATLFIGFTEIFLDMGLSVGILHKNDTTPQQYSSLFWLNIISGIVLTTILCLISPIIAGKYGELELVSVLSLLSFTILFSSLGNQHKTIQQKRLRFDYICIIEVSAAIVSLVVAFISARNGYGIYSLVFATLSNAALQNISFLIVGLLLDHNISFHFSIKETVPFLKIGGYSIGSQIIDYYTRELDVIIISATLGKDTLGVYSLCKKLVMAFYGSINPILYKVLTPLLAEIQDDIKRMKEIYFSVVETMAVIGYPLYFAMSVLSVGILTFMYGADYAEDATVFSLLAIYYGYLSPGSSVGSLQTALGRTDLAFVWTICRVVISTCAIYLGAQFGIEWIVISLLLANILMSPLSWRVMIKPMINAGFWEFFLLKNKPYLYNIIYAIPFYFLFSRISNIYLCILIGILYVALYAVFLFVFKRDTFIVQQVILYIEKVRLFKK